MSQPLGEPTRVLAPPRGLDQLRSTFGDIFQYILPDHTLDPRWESEFLTRIDLPFALQLSWDKSRLVTKMTCHKLMAAIFLDLFAKIRSAGLQQAITSCGGCFAFRPQRSGTKLSTHAWGIAIDLNPESNQQGTDGNMDPGIISIFKDAHFTWGGDWQDRSRDPMHFQYCSGY